MLKYSFLVYKWVKLTTRDLYHDSYCSHPTSIYTFEVTITPRVRGCAIKSFEVLKFIATIVNVILHLKKKKQNDFLKKKVKRNKFNTYFFSVIVKFNCSNIVISINIFFIEEINVNLRESNSFLL